MKWWMLFAPALALAACNRGQTASAQTAPRDAGTDAAPLVVPIRPTTTNPPQSGGTAGAGGTMPNQPPNPNQPVNPNQPPNNPNQPPTPR